MANFFSKCSNNKVIIRSILISSIFCLDRNKLLPFDCQQ